MGTVALVLSVLALFLAFLAMVRSGGAAAKIEETERASRRRVESLAEEREEREKNLRMVVAALAAGEKLTRDQVLEGVLWHDVRTPRGIEMLAAGDVRVLDVRTAEEVSQGVLPGAIHIPVEEIEERFRELPPTGQKTLVYCAGGVRSAYACEFLTSEGYTGLYNLEGGMMSWNGPVEKT
jgi:rhodanese-related sulfurtransferase/Na+-transporting methylmalonyl-CoA/oxaloacetate decarboxylase gamma subunit